MTRNLTLTARAPGDEFRVDIAVTLDSDSCNPGCPVVLQLGPGMGVPRHWVELSPKEARALAKHLTEVADEVEHNEAEATAF